MRSLDDKVASEFSLCLSSAKLLSKSSWHVLGSLVHFFEGQREAPSAEHCPAQLAPFPQVTLKLVPERQQVTLLDWFAKVKAWSKKLTEKVFAAFPIK